MSREFLMIHREVSYGTADLSGGAPAANKYIYVRLDEGNSFTARERPVHTITKYGGGFDVPAFAVADTFAVTGQLKLKLCYVQAAFLLPWLVTRINTGRTTPFTTTDAANVMPAGDLASMSIYHAKMRNDGTYERKRVAGSKAARWRIDCSRQEPRAILTVDILAQKAVGNQPDGSSDPNATEFPLPGVTDFPTDVMLFSHTAGALTIDSARTLYDSLSINCTNVLKGNFYESRHLSMLNFFGRLATLGGRLHYKASPNDRTAFEAITQKSVEVTWGNGTNTAKVDFNTKNIYTGLEDDLPLDDVYKQSLDVTGFYDTSVGGDQGDMSVAFT